MDANNTLLNQHKVFVVLPAWNESSVLESVAQEIHDAGYNNIIIVDDGSEDNTYEIAQSLPHAFAFRHHLNRGKGAATKTGIEAAKLLNADIIVTMDSDGQHDPNDIPKLIQPIVDGKCDVVLGTRLKDHTGMPWHKVLANWVGNALTWYLYGLWVSDSQSGFRAYSHQAASLIDTRSDRYDYESEVIHEIRRHRLRFTEVPVSVRYTTYSMRKPERQSFSNGLKTLGRIIWRLLT